MKKDRLVTITGSDYERGVQIGEKIGYSIMINFKNQVRHYKQAMDYDFYEWVEKCKNYIPYVEKYTPHTYYELRGMADGAKIPFEYVLALTTAYELAVAGGGVADKCTGFFAAGDYTLGEGVYCGQTNDEDFSEWIPFLDVVLRHENPDGISSMVYTHPGIASYMGMNDRGIGVLWQYIDNGERAMGVPTNCILREMLFFDKLADIVQYLKDIPHTIPNHYLISSKVDGVASVECFPTGVYLRESMDHIGHGNNVVTPEKMDGCDKKNPLLYRDPLSIDDMIKEAYEGALEGTPGVLEWSYLRYDRIYELLEENKGNIDAEVAKGFLADHKYEPFSICSHPNFVNTRWKTLASIVFDLEKEKMHIAFGSACEEDFYEFEFRK
ncbi:MAG: hypothetical protein IJO94_05765 [Firmicutes bacterium]|nr:hypothetical protein [Bacillota bacterium]MBQ6810890.1 hypothetical protein [Bacillota bacterium]